MKTRASLKSPVTDCSQASLLDRASSPPHEQPPNHHKKTFPSVWPTLTHFPVHQPAATNSMHPQSTHTPHPQHIQSEAHMESSRTSAVEPYCGNSQRIKAVGYFRRSAPLWMFDRILNCNPALHTKNLQHSLECLATLPRTFDDSPWNIWQHSPECLVTFPKIFGDIPRNVWRHSPECLTTFSGI